MTRPPKPRIRKPRLTWRWSRSRGGAWDPYYRVTWTENGRRKSREIRLDWKGDPERLDLLYWEAHSGRHLKQAAVPKHSWRVCVETWRADPRVQQKLADSTKAQYRRVMDAILEKNADKAMQHTTRQAVKAAVGRLAGTPRKAARYAQVVSLLWNYAANELDWPLGPNPAKKLGNYKARRGYAPWPDWMVKKLEDAPETVRTAARLILGTGQRPSAAISMRRDQFRGEWMVVCDEKAGQDLEVYCPPSLRAYIDALPVHGQHVLAKTLTTPLTYSAVESMFRSWRSRLGDHAKPYSLHGLRKLAIIELAEAGASDAEIQAVTGQSAEMVAYYRAKANRKQLSKAVQTRRDRT